MSNITNLIDRLLAETLSDETRAELEDMRNRAVGGEVEDIDANYVRALHRRLVGSSGPEVPSLSRVERNALSLLGLSWPTSQRRIEDRHRELVTLYRPESNEGDPTAAIFLKAVETAFETLSRSQALARA